MKFAVPCNEADIIIVVVSCLSELFHVSVLLLSVNQHIEWLTIICFSQCEELKYSESDSMAYECLWHLQLWTMYCESLAALSFTDTDSYVNAHQTVMDFWGRVTPGILQLLSHSKVVRLFSCYDTVKTCCLSQQIYSHDTDRLWCWQWFIRVQSCAVHRTDCDILLTLALTLTWTQLGMTQ